MRHCRKCNLSGHNSATCKYVPCESQPKSLKEIGREILQQDSIKAPRIEIDGLTPRRGLFIINATKKRCAGKILRIKKNGNVLWQTFHGVIVESKQSVLIAEHYKYSVDIPKEKDYTYLQLGEWTNDSTMKNVDEPLNPCET